jgi:hypothetical protein
LIDRVRERIGSIHDIANALADNLPAPKQHSGKSRRRRRKKKNAKQQTKQPQAQKNGDVPAEQPVVETAAGDGRPAAPREAEPAEAGEAASSQS